MVGLRVSGRGLPRIESELVGLASKVLVLTQARAAKAIGEWRAGGWSGNLRRSGARAMRTMAWKPHLNSCESSYEQEFRDASARTCIVRGIALLIALVNKSELLRVILHNLQHSSLTASLIIYPTYSSNARTLLQSMYIWLQSQPSKIDSYPSKSYDSESVQSESRYNTDTLTASNS